MPQYELILPFIFIIKKKKCDGRISSFLQDVFKIPLDEILEDDLRTVLDGIPAEINYVRFSLPYSFL
jgi:hypothetical protein